MLVPTHTVYRLDQLRARKGKEEFVTTDGRFLLREEGNSCFSYWHDTEVIGKKTRIGNPIKGPEGIFYTFFTKESALAVLNKICAHYGC